MNPKIQALLDKYKNIPGERFFDEVFISEVYKDALDKKANVIVDLGALAGEFGAYMYDKADVIHSIEMFSKSYKELVDNVKEFKLDKIKPYHLAIANYNGKGSMSLEDSRGGHMLNSGVENEFVEVKTLATFMKDEGIVHIDILKVDIEGGELNVFKSNDFASIVDKISYIIGEHSNNIILEKYGFVISYNEQNVWTAKRK